MRTIFEMLIPDTIGAVDQAIGIHGYSHCSLPFFSGSTGTGGTMRKVFIHADSLVKAQSAAASAGCQGEVCKHEDSPVRQRWLAKAQQARQDGQHRASAHYAALLIRAGVSSRQAWGL